MKRLATLLALLLCMAVPATAAPHWWEEGPPLPKLTGRVVDDAHLLPPAPEAALVARLARLEKRTGHQFVIVTVPGLSGQTIETFAIRLGRTWGIGRRDIDDGLLLIVAPKERKVRIEVGKGLETTLPDDVCAQIIRDRILPRFRGGDMVGGIVDGAGALLDRLEKASR